MAMGTDLHYAVDLGSRPDHRVIPHFNRPDKTGIRTDKHIIADFRMPLLHLVAQPAEGTGIEMTARADNARLPSRHTSMRMVEKSRIADPSLGVDICLVVAPAQLGDRPRQ